MKRATFTALTASALLVPVAARAQGPAAATVRIGTAPVEAYAISYYARNQGFFKNNGIDAQIITVPGASGGITAALIGGAIDVGCVSIGPTSNAHLRGIPLRIIAPGGIYTSAAPTTALLVTKNSPIQTAKDLNGKTLGTSVLRDLMHVATLKWIDSNGGDAKSVKIVELPVTDGGAALVSGRIDAYPLVEPLLSGQLDQGNLRVLGNIYDSITPRLMISMHIGMADWLDKNAAVARRVVLAMRQAAAWANANPAGVATVLEQEAKLPAAAIAKMKHIVNGETLEIPTIQPQIDALFEYKFIERRYPVTDIIWR
jgi:NitT/TauT family transport system substrate-binding protein